MVHPKQIASEVLETIIEDNSEPYRIESFEQIGSMSKNLNLYYADSFVDCIKNNSFKGRLLDEFSKFHNVATTYGYRGFSSGKKNGIVNINQSSKILLKDYNKLLTAEVIKKYDLDNPQPIKVVAHVDNGNRLIGVLDKTKKEDYHVVVILGISNSTGKIK